MKLTDIIEPKYKWKHIQAVANWLNYGSSERSVITSMLKFQKDFPISAQKYNGICYRAFGLSTTNLNKILKNKAVNHRKLESWTADKKGIIEFLEYTNMSTMDNPNIIAVLKTKPSANEVFLNIPKLFKDKEWNDSIRFWENKDEGFNEGLDFGNSQKEIVLARTAFSIDDIYAVIENNKMVTTNIKQKLMDSKD